MDITEWVVQLGPWAWIIAGVVLLVLEIFVPGGVLLWFGVAGILTGLAAFFQPIDWPFQFLLFGVLSIVLIVAWMRYFKPPEVPSDRPLLNRRTASLMGSEAVLDEPIVSGNGRMAIGDSVWRVAGPDLPAGSRVRVVGADGATLRVEPSGEAR